MFVTTIDIGGYDYVATGESLEQLDEVILKGYLKLREQAAGHGGFASDCKTGEEVREYFGGNVTEMFVGQFVEVGTERVLA